MKIEGRHYRTIWPDRNGGVIVIDQTKLPFAFELKRLETTADAAEAIRAMIVRGAPLIGATAAYGVALAMRTDASDANLDESGRVLGATRPTAVNLHWALQRMARVLRPIPPRDRATRAFEEAAGIADEDVECCRAIGRAWGGNHPQPREAQERRAGERSHALQRRLARDRRLGHGARADLCGA